MYRRYIADNNREHERRARDRYYALLRRHNVPQKYANEELTRAEMAVMPLRDWRHVPDPAEDAAAFVEAWREMQQVGGRWTTTGCNWYSDAEMRQFGEAALRGGFGEIVDQGQANLVEYDDENLQGQQFLTRPDGMI